MNARQTKHPAFNLLPAVIFAVMIAVAASRAAGQTGTSQTVIQKATEQFENSPLKITSVGQSLYIFSGDGGNVTAIVDDASTFLIDSGMASRISELNEAISKTTMR